jgi:hypothetical protein
MFIWGVVGCDGIYIYIIKIEENSRKYATVGMMEGCCCVENEVVLMNTIIQRKVAHCHVQHHQLGFEQSKFNSNNHTKSQHPKTLPFLPFLLWLFSCVFCPST